MLKDKTFLAAVAIFGVGVAGAFGVEIPVDLVASLIGGDVTPEQAAALTTSGGQIVAAIGGSVAAFRAALLSRRSA